MTFSLPEYSKSQINRAGDILKDFDQFPIEDQVWSSAVLANWRASHGYPINTFQATLRARLKTIDSIAIVAQRLKRTPSIVQKLQRFDGMQLARMQDIGGLRAVISTMPKVLKLEALYRDSKFKHELTGSKNYVTDPKPDGYRGIHLIYRYKNDLAPDYNGLSLELQIRTRLQHAWATAVETMGTFLGQALKSGQGEDTWRRFFSTASAALAVVEKTNPVPGFENYTNADLFNAVAESQSSLGVLDKLRGFAVAADKIIEQKGRGAYHLIILDSVNRSVTIRPFSSNRLDEANAAYGEIEKQTRNGESIEAVLVSAGPIDALKKAYPNYFLDTQEFVNEIEKLTKIQVKGHKS